MVACSNIRLIRETLVYIRTHMFAVIKTGGKQYIVQQGTILKVERLPGQKGDKIDFNEVLLVGDDGEEAKIGTPNVSGAKVSAVIEDQARHEKITVIKYKRKIRYKRKLGHRQFFTKVKIEKIVG